jgi:pyridoxal phosphate enzyme (YggS family)
MIDKATYINIKQYCDQHGVTLVAVSKTKPVEAITELYQLGQRIFGENKVQELLEKAKLLPEDIQWHLIGHLQTNKVKQVLPRVALIHSVDSMHLMEEIEIESAKLSQKTEILLQLKIAVEETKYGLNDHELKEIIQYMNEARFPHLIVRGLMGMASFTEAEEQVKKEFAVLKSIFDETKEMLLSPANFNILSMGMSGDFHLAVSEGSNMVRVGSLIFGER